MEDKKLIDDKLRKFEELVEKLERISDDKPHPEGPKHKHHPHPPIHPHERKELKIDFMQDEELLKEIFEDDDTVKAIIDIIITSPTEIQIVLKIVIDLYRKIIESKGE